MLGDEKHLPLPPLRYGFPLQRGQKIEKQGLLIFNGLPPLEGERRQPQGEVLFAGGKMLPYSRNTKLLARELRKNQTPAEELLWSRIRGKQILDVQFKRQKPIANYIVDFYGVEAKLVVELDGSQHYEADAIANDLERTKILESLGLKVIRFDNSQIFNELESVLTVIYNAVKMRT